METQTKPVAMILVSRELLNTAVNGYAQEQGHALNSLREILKEKGDSNDEGTSTSVDGFDGLDDPHGNSDIGLQPLAEQNPIA